MYIGRTLKTVRPEGGIVTSMFLGVACQCVFYWNCEANALSIIMKEAFCYIELFSIT